MNALCGLIEQCSSSSEYHVQRLPYNQETWTRAFNIYLTQSDNNKSKPLRRLLLTLTRLILKRPVSTENNLLLGIATCTATRAIRKQDEFANIKPAIQALQHFIKTGLMSAAEIAQIKKPEELELSRIEPMKTNGENSYPQQQQIDQSIQNFALSALEWIQYPDCAPAIGRFLTVFFRPLEESHSHDAVRASIDGAMPLWVSPVKHTLERHQGLWDVFEIHILPGLLRLGPADVEAFLKTLPFESIQHGNIGFSSVSDIQLCLLVAKTAKDSNLLKRLGQGQSTSLDLEDLGINLLEYPSSGVRITALSLLVSSAASARPFCRRVLCHMRQCIPYFHVEVNAKPRNEFIALMNKLCTRLCGATLVLLRRSQDNVAREQASNTAPVAARFDAERSAIPGHVIEQALDEESQILEEHLAFRKWYMVFLLQELRPTASYQSHITALRVLEFMTDQTIALRYTSPKSHNDYFSALNEYLPRSLFLRSLTELLLDPFDDVRQSAHRVFDLHLSTNSIPRIRAGTDDRLDSIDKTAKYQTEDEDDHRKANDLILIDVNKAENRAVITGRADHADGFGRLYNLLFATSGALAKSTKWHQSRYMILDHVISMLENEVDVARKDLLFAVSNMPLHGHLTALR